MNYIVTMLDNTPLRGTKDWFPAEYRIRKYIFDTWRRVCTGYGFEEYLTPILEDAEIYRAKSGEDAGGKELLTFKDKAGRDLAIRPEMTPSVTRMVTRFYNSVPKPIRLFSIANFWRNEKPQRGRNREFWQLNVDIFGADSIYADIEVLQLAIDIMLAFNPPEDSFVLYMNDRHLIEKILEDVLGIAPEDRVFVVRIIDKWEKFDTKDLVDRLSNYGISSEKIDLIQRFMDSNTRDELLSNFPQLTESDLSTIEGIIQYMKSVGYDKYIEFRPNIIRGFDYYDGMVFEVFDKHPNNSRALFGGGRYNGLAGVFGKESFPAVGFAPGDEPLRLFLESWNLLDNVETPKVFYIPVLNNDWREEYNRIARRLRSEGHSVIVSIDDFKSVGSALKQANKLGVSYVVLYGEYERNEKKFIIKDMDSGKQEEFSF